MHFFYRVILFSLIVLISPNISAQQFKLKGQVVDQLTNKPLSFANIRVANSTIGTSANSVGDYEINLENGYYQLIASFIGYSSDTVNIKLESNLEISFKLKSTTLELAEVTVIPGANPALEIIRRAIEAKQKRNELLNSYILRSYTKGAIKTTGDLMSDDRSVGISMGESDTSELKITGILENESIGYYKKPGNFKEEILARKQSANFPSSINILTGGRVIQNISDDDVQFFGRPLPSPISDQALNYYYFYVEDTLAQDDKTVFQIYFAPDDESDPGFYGRVYIMDKTFSLAKIDVQLNDAANPGGLFTKVNVFQQYVVFEKNIFMPVDYRIFVEGNFLGLAKFGFELNTILHDYKINAKIEDDFFDMAVITVLPNADEKDSSYWSSIQTIPNTLEEVQAYNRIDSLESVPTTFWDRFSFTADRISINDNVAVSGPLYIYHFNRVEGHAIDFNFFWRDAINKRLNSTFNIGHGFSDKYFKSDFNGTYYLGKYRTGKINFHAYKKLTDLFGETNNYNLLTSTVLNWFSKYDFRDYYYTKGFAVKFDHEIFPILELGIGYKNRTDNTADVNSDWSLFNKQKKVRENKQIYDVKINAFTAEFKLDFRKYIEDGYYRRRIFRDNLLPVIRGRYVHSSENNLKSDISFDRFSANLLWRIPSFKSAVFSVDMNGTYSTGAVPFQMMYALPGNINGGAKTYSFRTLRIGEVYGDRVYTVSIEHDFRDELFRILKIPFLRDNQFLLRLYLNAAWVDVSDKSMAIMTEPNPILYKSPFFELGFGIGQILFPMSLEFTWKLNYKGKNNFVIGFNTFAL